MVVRGLVVQAAQVLGREIGGAHESGEEVASRVEDAVVGAEIGPAVQLLGRALDAQATQLLGGARVPYGGVERGERVAGDIGGGGDRPRAAAAGGQQEGAGDGEQRGQRRRRMTGASWASRAVISARGPRVGPAAVRIEPPPDGRRGLAIVPDRLVDQRLGAGLRLLRLDHQPDDDTE